MLKLAIIRISILHLRLYQPLQASTSLSNFNLAKTINQVK